MSLRTSVHGRVAPEGGSCEGSLEPCTFPGPTAQGCWEPADHVCPHILMSQAELTVEVRLVWMAARADMLATCGQLSRPYFPVDSMAAGLAGVLPRYRGGGLGACKHAS